MHIDGETYHDHRCLLALNRFNKESTETDINFRDNQAKHIITLYSGRSSMTEIDPQTILSAMLTAMLQPWHDAGADPSPA